MTAPIKPIPPRGSQEDDAFLQQLAQSASDAGMTASAPEPQPVLGSHPDHLSGQSEFASDPTTAPQPPPAGEPPLANPLADPQVKGAAIALYGADFPLLRAGPPTDGQWSGWAQGLWDRHRAGMQKVLHIAERNRFFRRGDQWIASHGFGPWREPPKPRDAIRAVENVIKPALDQRVQILREQVPGFRTRPTSQDVDAQKKAEAQQIALEYSYAEQNMAEVLAEAAFWVGTDGVAFLGPYWHPDVGPWSEADQAPMGDARTCVYRIEQVRVSANASATEQPHYWIIRETIPTAQAVAQHGPAVLGQNAGEGAGADLATMMGTDRLGRDAPSIDELYRDQPTVDRYTVYCEKSQFLPQGLTLITVGNVTVVQAPLLYGVVPMVRMTDGSADPAFFPEPIMNDWVPHQIRINALVSKWIESIRVNAGGRFLMKSGTVATETLVGGTTSVLEVKGAFNSINDAMTPVTGFSVGQDVKDALERERTTFEQKSGWNDASRGSFASDASGRAILAVREQLERIFAPGIASAASAMSEWGKVVLAIYRHMLTAPRTMAVVGTGRPDLGRQLTSEDFNGVSEVEIDPETLMPMPRSLKMSLLEQLYQEQVISAQEYRRRMPFSFTGSIATPDDAQDARAQRVVDAIRQGQPVPEVRWTDNEAIHQDALEREILTSDDEPPEVVQAAMQRWVALANQAQMKRTGMAPPMPGAPAGPPNDPGQMLPGGPPNPTPLDPSQQPLVGQNSSVASSPVQSDEQMAGQRFDAMSHQ